MVSSNKGYNIRVFMYVNKLDCLKQLKTFLLYFSYRYPNYERMIDRMAQNYFDSHKKACIKQ